MILYPGLLGSDIGVLYLVSQYHRKKLIHCSQLASVLYKTIFPISLPVKWLRFEPTAAISSLGCNGSALSGQRTQNVGNRQVRKGEVRVRGFLEVTSYRKKITRSLRAL